MSVCLYVSVYVQVCVCTCMCASLSVYMYICVCVHACVCIYLSLFIVQVYDLSSFVDHHPGGLDQILYGAGRDITQLFEPYHPFLAYK